MKTTLTLCLILVACGGAPEADSVPEQVVAQPSLQALSSEDCAPVKAAPLDTTYKISYSLRVVDGFEVVSCGITGPGVLATNIISYELTEDAAPYAPCWVVLDSTDSSGGFDFVQEQDGSGQVAARFHDSRSAAAEGVWHLDCK